ncbi:restriction endonuclease subunit S [Streptomyces sp. NPDC102360]|uniref:restriction endonuclease subunit S n=1 Tax=Streptomyces sp. NPDC102360 TaxID=3366160 RepID=UPI003815AF98
MSKWPSVALADVAKIERSTIQPEDIAPSDSYVGLENIARGGDFVNLKNAGAAGVASAKFRFTPRQVLFGKLRPYLAKIACPDFGGVCSTDILPITPGPDLDRSYLRRFLALPDTIALAVSRSTGANLPRLSPKALAEFSLPLPPLEEQRRIAQMLDHVDGLRARRRKAIALLDDLTQAIFLDMFGDPAQARPNFPMRALVDTVEAPLQNGAYYPKELYVASGGVEMVHMGDAFYGKVERGNLKRVACSDVDRKKYSLGSGDVLVARRSLNYEGSAKPCLVPASREPLIFESSLIRVTPSREIATASYIYHYLNNQHVRERFVFPFVTGATISGISQKNLAQIPVMTPPIEMQMEFASRLEGIDRVRSGGEFHLAEIDSLFASLQYRAFRGELQLDIPMQPRTQPV